MEIPKNFDWVAARSRCSLLGIFSQLAEVIDSDVKAARALPESDETFAVNRPTKNKIVVVKSWNAGGVPEADNIVFELTNTGITVRVGGLSPQELFVAKPSLLPNGECKLQIEGEMDPLELWQVSRRALENLFFSRRAR